MLGEGGTPLEKLQAAVREFLARKERRVDLKEYRAVIDGLDGDFSACAREAQRAGEHLVAGSISATVTCFIALGGVQTGHMPAAR